MNKVTKGGNKVTKGGIKNTEKGIKKPLINLENNFIEISVNEPFVFLLNEQRLIYTLTELLEHSKLDDSELDLDDIPF